jgi:hypothetical protein
MVQEIDENEECPYLRMRTLVIWEAQEAMEEGVFIRENGCPRFLA